MSALIADPPKQEVDAPQPTHAHACTNCGTGLAVGQDWCLECGTAVPGRFGRSTGMRASVGIVGVTLVLVIGAVAAAYAALSSDANHAAKPPVVAAAATTPPAAAAVTPGATPPAAVGPAKPAVLPKLPAKVPVTATPKPSATTTTPKATTPKATTPKATTPAKTPPSTGGSGTILLDTNAATTYNPYGYPDSSFGDPLRAIDGDTTTSWTYQLDPSHAGKVAVGLAIDLKTAHTVRSIKLRTPSPGMAIEVYGATGEEPVSIIDPNWLHLATRRALKSSQTISLKNLGKPMRFLLVWITRPPAGRTTGTVGISEISVKG